MKDLHIKIFIFLFFLITSCKPTHVGIASGGLNEAMIKSINDFRKKNKVLLEQDNIFFILSEEQADYFRILIVGSSEKSYLYNSTGSPYENKFPSNYLELDNKLFIWYDDDKPIDSRTIEIYNKYNLLVDDENGNIMYLDETLDDKKKGALYFYCKNNLSKLEKIVSNKTIRLPKNLVCN